MAVVEVALPTPLRRRFDYLSDQVLPAGVRVRVPFGRRELVGLVLASKDRSELPAARLKPVKVVLDSAPLLGDDLLSLLQWLAGYYHHPIGEVIDAALPPVLRGGGDTRVGTRQWQLNRDTGDAAPKFGRSTIAPRLWARLVAGPADSAALTGVHPRWRPIIKLWLAEGRIIETQRSCSEAPTTVLASAPMLTPEQQRAVDHLTAAAGFAPRLLFGVTGSGKTEVYLQLVQRVLAQDRQVLLLVPEIGLTPQLLARIRSRFGAPLVVWHSQLGPRERLCSWQAARSGEARIVVGTRSAVFLSFAALGLIVVDEEHDASYKQQDGFRYHARDVALVRAHRAQIPIVLGSATPALETLLNVAQGRFTELALTERPAAAQLPRVHLLDMRKLAQHDGLSAPLVEAIKARLDRGEQSLLFINRRGFAPALYCGDCGYLAPCPRCDARLIWHKRVQRLRCHHCGLDRAAPMACPSCGSARLLGIGAGTQRVETALQRFFPAARVLRIDRDSERRGDSDLPSRAEAADVLVGTQMLSKGHDFPRVTLVGVLDADQGLYGLDFRAGEQLFQQMMQVAGRAGRAALAGEVLVQTHVPQHALFQHLMRHDYRAFADYALRERRAAHYPPYTHLALLRAEATNSAAPIAFLRAAHAKAIALTQAGVEIMDPGPAPMERRAGRYRAQLLLQASERAALHAMLTPWLAACEQLREGARVRWSLDIDPLNLY